MCRLVRLGHADAWRYPWAVYREAVEEARQHNAEMERISRNATTG